MKPFNGLERFKERCASFDKPQEPEVIKQIEAVTIVPRSGLFDIVKRRTNKAEFSKEDVIGHGFTYAEAVEFRSKYFKKNVNMDTKVVTYYDIVPQDNKEALSPLWNPKEITKEGGTDTQDENSGKDTKIEWVG